MKKGRTQILMIVFVITLLVGKVSVQAATQEVQGSSSQTKTVPVTASVASVYSISLPASISLSYGMEKDDTGNLAEGYWFRLQYGVAGKITSAESIYVETVLPCVLTDAETGAEMEILELSKTRCKEEWSYEAVGNCSYDGQCLSNCEYVYCCSKGHVIGVRTTEAARGTFKGNLTFHFGIK